MRGYKVKILTNSNYPAQNTCILISVSNFDSNLITGWLFAPFLGHCEESYDKNSCKFEFSSPKYYIPIFISNFNSVLKIRWIIGSSSGCSEESYDRNSCKFEFPRPKYYILIFISNLAKFWKLSGSLALFRGPKRNLTIEILTNSNFSAQNTKNWCPY